MTNNLRGNISEHSIRACPRLHILVPAAGIGRRFGADRPKQYMRFLETSLIDHSLNQLQKLKSTALQIEGLDLKGCFIVGVDARDGYWASTKASESSQIIRVAGGATRAKTVSNMLAAIEVSQSEDTRGGKPVESLKDDWVLIHDAVRPCISQQSLEGLLMRLTNSSASGLSLGRPIYEAVKRVSKDPKQLKVLSSEDRDGLWTTQTPQIFRFQALKSSLDACLREDLNFDDEMMALHHSGFETEMVRGSPWNLKITQSEDLQIARNYWQIMTNIESNQSK